jgi:hypothetical protein
MTRRGNLSVSVCRTEPRPQGAVLRYFISFSCYGNHLRWDESGSVARNHNAAGSRLQEPDPSRASTERREMRQSPYSLDRDSCAAVLAALRGHCAHRGCSLLTAHVRTEAF